jgi:hypothetical protein
LTTTRTVATTEADAVGPEAELLQALGRRIELIDDRLQAIESAASSKPASKAPSAGTWDWSTLTPEALADAWRDLADWFRLQVRDKALEERVPRCWYRHPGFVAQLAALRAWHAKTLTAEASGYDAASWHEAFGRMVESVWPRYAAHPPHGVGADESGQMRRARREATERDEIDAWIEAQTEERRRAVEATSNAGGK